MTIKEMRDQRNKLIADAQQILLANPDAEKRSAAHKMIEDAGVVLKDIEALEAIEAAQAEERSKTTPARPVPGDQGNKAEIEKRAFERFIRTGEIAPELRAGTVGLTTDASYGGQFVPQAFYPVLTQAMKAYGNILNVVKQITTDSGAPMKYALVDDTASFLDDMTEDNSTAADEGDPSLGGSTISSDFFTSKVVKVSLPELNDSAFDIDAFIREAFGIRYYRSLSQMVTVGSNSGNIGSIVTGSYLGATLADPTKGIQWADVAAMYAALDPAYRVNAKWSMNTVSQGALLGVTDSLGRPLYIPAPTADAFDRILGKDVVINPFMDNPAQAGSDKYPVLYGDHSAYLLRNVKPGLAIARMNERYLDTGAIGFVGFVRAGGKLLDAGTHPMLKLKVAHSGS